MDREVSRRDAIKFVGGIALTAGLAGCSEQSQGGTEQPDTSAGQTPTQQPEGTPTAQPDQTATATETQTATATPGADPGTEVSFSTSGGTEVTAASFGEGSCGVVLVHGKDHSYTDWAPVANAIAEAGSVVLAIDASGGSASANAERVAGAVSYLQSEQGVSNIVAVGAGAGSSAVVRANNATQAINGTVAISPESADAAQIAPDISGQLLIVVASGDEQTYKRIAQGMHSAATDPKRLEEVATDAHGQAIFDSEQGGKLESLLVEFSGTVCSA